MRIASAWSPTPTPVFSEILGIINPSLLKENALDFALINRQAFNSHLAFSLCQGSLYPQPLWLIAQLLIEDSVLPFQGRKESRGFYCRLSTRWVSWGAAARLLRRWMTTSGSFKLESSRVGLKQQGNELHIHLCCWIGPEWSRKSLKGHSCCSRRFPSAVKRT